MPGYADNHTNCTLEAGRTIDLEGVVTALTPAAAPLPTPTTERLLARARRGEAGALGLLIARCLPDLHKWAHRRLPRWIRSAADTHDVVQDAVLGTLARLDAFQPQGRRALAGYLRTAVRNRIADEHRRAARWLVSAAPAEALPSDAASPLQQAIDHETERRYRAALARLSTRDQQLIVAHFELDYSHAQLGCMIGRSPHAARMALTRAIARLAAQMRD
ncbi:MAG TPA: sigma-70 family RNA polymerase sigma factor [Vicinamibacterales bacterium]|nr:sigma-70 family RNA polymerase sigma factor [Vicinamibacterales bacterium]